MPTIFTPAGATAITIPHPADAQTAAEEWLAHLTAGRLTAASGPGTTPEIAANRARTDAIFARRAAFHRFMEGR